MAARLRSCAVEEKVGQQGLEARRVEGCEGLRTVEGAEFSASISSASAVIGLPRCPWIHEAPIFIGRSAHALLVWMRPPMRLRASNTVTRCPASDKACAAARPAMPAPTTNTERGDRVRALAGSTDFIAAPAAIMAAAFK